MTLTGNVLTLIDNICVRLINIIAPKPCAVCGDRLGLGENVICSVCNAHMPRTHYQRHPYDNKMARLFWGRIPVERAAALFFFEPHSEMSRIVYSFKYHRHPADAEHMGRMTAAEFMIDGFFNGVDVIVPVPLTHSRQRSRGYNQSMELARGISGVTGIPVAGNAVTRNTFTKSQTRMNRWQRIENVEDAFSLKNGAALSGRHVLIVDDVVTSGSTVTACAREILKAGNVKISVLSLGFAKY